MPDKDLIAQTRAMKELIRSNVELIRVIAATNATLTELGKIMKEKE